MLPKRLQFLRSQRFVLIIVAIALLLGARQVRLSDPPLIASLRALTFDTYQRLKPRQPLGQPIRIIDIDEESIAEYGQWPWPRTLVARLVDRVGELGAACIAFDIVFSEPDRTGPAGFIRQMQERDWPGQSASIEPIIAALPDNDAILAKAMTQFPTVLGFFNQSRSSLGLPEAKAGFAMLGDDPAPVLNPIRSSVMSLPPYREAAAGSGSISLAASDDGVIRQVPMFLAAENGTKYPALALEALRVAQGAGSYVLKTSHASGEISAGTLSMTAFKVGQFEVPVTSDGQLRLYYAHNDPSLYVSAKDVMSLPDDKLEPLISGHIVFVGASASGLRDIRLTALGENVPGVSVHAQIVDQILSGEFLNRPDWARGAEILAMFAVTLLLVAIVPIAGAMLSALIGAVCGVALVSGSWVAFARYGILLDPVFPILVAAAIFLLATLYVFAITEREKRFVRGAFQRYLAPDLLRKLEEHPKSLTLGGEIRDMTLMFMDVRGFTPISEKLSPQELVTFLNRLLSPLSDAIQRHEGAIDKYIGDSIMAFWNAPLDVSDHPKKAVRAALEMIALVDELNREDGFRFRSEHKGLGEVAIGIGINSGLGCVGNMGSATRFNYSVVGDTVNVAARIESSCKEVGWPILISESTAAACSDFAFLEAGAIALKGKSKPATLYALIGDETLARTEAWRTLAELHARLLDSLTRKAPAAETDDLARQCLEVAPAGLEAFYAKLAAGTNVGLAAE